MISDRGSRTMRVTRAWLALACASCALAAWALGTGCMLAAAAEARGTPVVPGDGFAPGWLRSGPTMRFTERSLFDYIDGGAELFLEFGFKELLVQRYSRGTAELTLEIYRMESPEAALGIYLARSDAEAPVDGIRARNTGSPYQVTVLKGSVFLQVNNFEGGGESLPVMAALVNRALDRVPKGKPVRLLENLPRENLVPGSEALVRGPFGLQPIFTFGNGDVLLLGGKVFAVMADYFVESGPPPGASAGPREASEPVREAPVPPEGESEPVRESSARLEGRAEQLHEPRTDQPRDGVAGRTDTYTRILVEYPSRSAARRAYEHLVANLDPYLEVVRMQPAGTGAGGGTARSTRGGSVTTGFVFKDYRGKFGSAELSGRVMNIKINLSRES